MSHAHKPPATAAGAAPLLSYQPTPPQVSDEHSSQRWFTGYDAERGNVFGQASRLANGSTKTQVHVMRRDKEARAELALALYCAPECSFLTLLDAESLRKLAFILLDAAHDIEQNPASTLAQQAQEVA